VLISRGTAVIAGKAVGNLEIAFAFGFAFIAMAYGIGPISGCHINPAVSLGVFSAGRMGGKDLIGYVVGQILGGIAAAAVLAFIVAGIQGGYDVAASGLGERLGTRLPG
jgi:aquaporin Z